MSLPHQVCYHCPLHQARVTSWCLWLKERNNEKNECVTCVSWTLTIHRPRGAPLVGPSLSPKRPCRAVTKDFFVEVSLALDGRIEAFTRPEAWRWGRWASLARYEKAAAASWRFILPRDRCETAASRTTRVFARRPPSCPMSQLFLFSSPRKGRVFLVSQPCLQQCRYTR
jgi:hypothetical protein